MVLAGLSGEAPAAARRDERPVIAPKRPALACREVFGALICGGCSWLESQCAPGTGAKLVSIAHLAGKLHHKRRKNVCIPQLKWVEPIHASCGIHGPAPVPRNPNIPVSWPSRPGAAEPIPGSAARKSGEWWSSTEEGMRLLFHEQVSRPAARPFARRSSMDFNREFVSGSSLRRSVTTCSFGAPSPMKLLRKGSQRPGAYRANM